MQPISKLNSRHKLAKSQPKKQNNKLPRIPIPKNIKHNCKKKISRSSATNHCGRPRLVGGQRIGEKTSISQRAENRGEGIGRWRRRAEGSRSRRKGRDGEAEDEKELYKQLGIENNKQLGYWANI